MDKSKNVDTLHNVPMSHNTQLSSVVTPQKGVYFKIDPGTPISCGITCRQIMTVLTNIGNENAHNVMVSLDIHNNIGESVYSTQEQLGDIQSCQSICRIITMNIDCGSILTLYSRCRKHMPLILKMKIVCNECVQAFPDYIYDTKF